MTAPQNISKYEQATRCPKCDQPGKLASTNTVPGHLGTQVESWTCVNEACSWFTTGWIVQINPDGTIPDRTAGPKQYAPLSPGMETAARDYLRAIQQEEEVQSRGNDG
jgi:hypothetical protein